jgi:hypothetical protein
MLVCGLGESLASLPVPPRCRSIGVNDIGRAFAPTYLLCMDPLTVFPEDRRRFIQDSAARFIFTDADTGITGANVVSCTLGYSDNARAADEDSLYHRGAPLTSTYLALELAAFMGAGLIGLIGVDLCGGYFFNPGQTHNLNSCVEALNQMFLELGRTLGASGTRVVNLSDRSVLTAFPRMPLDAFRDMQDGEESGRR